MITLNRPDALNALNDQLMREVTGVLKGWATGTEIRCAVITGSPKAFAAGADISQMAGQDVGDMIRATTLDHWDAVDSCPIPVIAAVAGWALGGGCELAMCCDIVLAADTAKFGQPEIKIGVIPGAGGTQRLARAVGKSRTMEMTLTGDPIDAETAVAHGLASRVVPADDLLDEAVALASRIASMPPLAVRLGKDAVRAAFETPLAEGVKTERRNFLGLFGTADRKEGMNAFLEKRKPEWSGK